MKLLARFAVLACAPALFCCLAIAAPAFAEAPAAPALPGDSLYQLDLALADQDARATTLKDLGGSPLLITMFYTSCKFVCPLTIENLQRLERALTPEQKAAVRVVLVSIDPERDTPQALKKVAVDRHVDLARWTLARTDADGVRKLAAVLGVQYRKLEDGEFNHSTIVTLLDRQGRIVAHTNRTNEVDPELLAATRRELDKH